MTKINHPIEQEELMAYLDGELPPDQMATAAAHVKQCQDCQGVAADLQGVTRELMDWQVGSADQRMMPELLAALEEFGRKKGTRATPVRLNWRDRLAPRQWPRWVWGLAGAALVVLLSTMPRQVLYRKATPEAFVKEIKPEIHPGVAGQYSTDKNGTLSSFGDRQSTRTGYVANLKMTDGNLPPEKEGDFTSLNGVPQAVAPKTADSLTMQGPMIVRTAKLTLTTREFDKVRMAIEDILKRHGGYISDLSVSSPAGAARTLWTTLRVPANQLEATMAELRNLGRVESESQSGEEVTQEYVDLEARLSNARNTEKRLTDLLRERTGKLSDVLSVEEAIDRVRGEIERMAAEKERLTKRLDFATLNVNVKEDYKAQLQTMPASSLTQLHNAAVDGYRFMIGGLFSLILDLVSYGPSIVLWGAILFIPGRLVWKRLRRNLGR